MSPKFRAGFLTLAACLLVTAATGQTTKDQGGNAVARKDVPTGMVKGSANWLVSAVAGTDYLAPTGSGAALTGITQSQVSGLSAALAAKEATANKGVASGYAGLDGSLHVPTTNLGSGTASSSTYLRGDQTWAAVASGAVLTSNTFTGVQTVQNDVIVQDSGAVTVAQLTTATNQKGKLSLTAPAGQSSGSGVFFTSGSATGQIGVDGSSNLVMGRSTNVFVDWNTGGLYFRPGNGASIALQFDSSGNARFNAGLGLPTLADSAASLKSIYYGSDHTSGGQALLCYKDGAGSVSILGASSVAAAFTPTISLPTTLYAVVGHEANVYYDNILSSPFPSLALYDLPTTCNIGSTYAARWTATPVVGDVGNHTLTVAADFNATSVASSSTTVKVSAAKAASTTVRKVLAIGDSTTIDGRWLAELLNLCNFNCTSPTAAGGADNLTLTFVGTKTATVNDAGGTSRTVACEAVSGTTINYWRTNAASPMVFGGTFNFGTYLSNNSITMASNDWVLIHLGINDLIGQTSDATCATQITSMLSDLDAMITSIKAGVSGIRIGVMVTIPPSASQDGWATAGLSINRARHKRNIDLWRAGLVGHTFAANVFLCPVGHNIDTVNNFPTSSVAVNARNATTATVQTNFVHLAASGYYQMADAVYAFLRGQEP